MFAAAPDLSGLPADWSRCTLTREIWCTDCNVLNFEQAYIQVNVESGYHERTNPNDPVQGSFRRIFHGVGGTIPWPLRVSDGNARVGRQIPFVRISVRLVENNGEPWRTRVAERLDEPGFKLQPRGEGFDEVTVGLCANIGTSCTEELQQ